MSGAGDWFVLIGLAVVLVGRIVVLVVTGQ